MICKLTLIIIFVSFKVSNQCAVNNGGCSHFCVVKTSGYSCVCPAGLALKKDGRTCEESEFFFLVFFRCFYVLTCKCLFVATFQIPKAFEVGSYACLKCKKHE